MKEFPSGATQFGFGCFICEARRDRVAGERGLDCVVVVAGCEEDVRGWGLDVVLICWEGAGAEGGYKDDGDDGGEGEDRDELTAGRHVRGDVIECSGVSCSR